jgi:hypothetical protein
MAVAGFQAEKTTRSTWPMGDNDVVESCSDDQKVSRFLGGVLYLSALFGRNYAFRVLSEGPEL